MKVVAKPIDVVVWFDKNGVPNLVRFRLDGEEDESIIIKIDKIITRDKEKLAGNPMQVFTCQSNIRGKDTIYEIKFEFNTGRWILFKI